MKISINKMEWDTKVVPVIRFVKGIKKRPDLVFIKFILDGANGADKYGEAYAAWEGVETEVLKPDWEKHGKSAGYLRNAIIVEKADIVVAYWDGESKGTKHTIELAIRQRKPLIIIRVDER